jgi:hypothetical protein
MNVATLRVGAAGLCLSLGATAADLTDFSYRAGSDLGRAIYCREQTAGRFATLAEGYIRRTAADARSWGAAVVLFFDAARIRAAYGPISESCPDFLEGYQRALSALEQQRRILSAAPAPSSPDSFMK